MKQRIRKENINTMDYLNSLYSMPNYLGTAYDGARERLKLIVNNLKRYDKHLDVGCANGEFTKYYLEKYPDTKGYGTDISEVALDLARTNCPQGHFSVTMPKEMDLIHCGEVLEHVDDPQKFIDSLRHALKPGGTLILTTPNNENDACGEHVWRWDVQGVKELLTGFKVVKEEANFFNGHLMYLEAIKI